jgi:transposase InsO family protein
LLKWADLNSSKYYAWQERQGQENRHNGRIPKTHWLLEAEKEAIRQYYRAHPGEGYRRLSYMMLDEGIAAVSPGSVYRVLTTAGLLKRWSSAPSGKGKGFKQPVKAHQHWHIDIAYLNIAGTFYYLCTILDGYSRYVIHWEIRAQMTEEDVEIILQRAREKFPEARPRIISDNGPQFIARDFKDFIRLCQMTHVRTSPGYPQSNGKIERWHKTVKGGCIRPKTPHSLEAGRRVVNNFVTHYNEARLHSAIGYITPKDKLLGREKFIFTRRKQKLELARQHRRKQHLSAEQTAPV